MLQGQVARSALDAWLSKGGATEGIPSEAGFKSMQEATAELPSNLDAHRAAQVLCRFETVMS